MLQACFKAHFDVGNTLCAVLFRNDLPWFCQVKKVAQVLSFEQQFDRCVRLMAIHSYMAVPFWPCLSSLLTILNGAIGIMINLCRQTPHGARGAHQITDLRCIEERVVWCEQIIDGSVYTSLFISSFIDRNHSLWGVAPHEVEAFKT